MRSIVITPNGEATAAVLHGSDLRKAIGCDTCDGRRVCGIPGGGFLYVYFDDNFIAKRLPVNNQVRGLYGGGDLCGTVVLQACNEVGNTIDLPSTTTTDNWRSEIDRLRAPAGCAPQIHSTATSGGEALYGRETDSILGRPIADLEASLIAKEGKEHAVVGGQKRLDGFSVIIIGDWALIRSATPHLDTAYFVTRRPVKAEMRGWPSLQLAWNHRNTAPDDDPAVHQQVWQAWLDKRG